MESIYIWAGLAIGLAGVGVAVGQGILAQNSMHVMGKNPRLSTFFLTITILGVALVESAAIYGLVVAFKILGTEGLEGVKAIGAGLAIGLTSLGAGIGEGKLVGGALEAINRNPENKVYSQHAAARYYYFVTWQIKNPCRQLDLILI